MVWEGVTPVSMPRSITRASGIAPWAGLRMVPVRVPSEVWASATTPNTFRPARRANNKSMCTPSQSSVSPQTMRACLRRPSKKRESTAAFQQRFGLRGLFNHQERDVVSLRHALRENFHRVQNPLLYRQTSRRSFSLDNIEQSFLSEHFLLRIFRVREPVRIHHQNICDTQP